MPRFRVTEADLREAAAFLKTHGHSRVARYLTADADRRVVGALGRRLKISSADVRERIERMNGAGRL